MQMTKDAVRMLFVSLQCFKKKLDTTVCVEKLETMALKFFHNNLSCD